MVPLDEKPFDKFEPICEVDADCPRPDLGQVCLNYYWDATLDGNSFANGVACYNWEYPVCPGDEFASFNYNYENTGWSAYTQMSCKDSSGSSASSLIEAAAMILTTLTLF